MINVLEPSSLLDKDSTELEPIIVANTFIQDATAEPRIELVIGTPDWQNGDDKIEILSTKAYKQNALDVNPTQNQSMDLLGLKIGSVHSRAASMAQAQHGNHFDLMPPKAATARNAEVAKFHNDLNADSKKSSFLMPADNFSEEEFKAKVRLAPPQRVMGGDDIAADEALIEEYDAPDDETET
mmetsp:Transcript_23283/g.28860  ORF Transcript_23283/g.28860 Transcript_23283/m.28860 type:complete len:183 (+) Transcript_23283:740-1288(+)|eukprot:CAMPEP_0170477692 /NCGR_PEP_ID=MMETSP0123-20130129/18884_1 /TAXON_ID=182087 /ORGANISM="Favella ehrenbergii, Strain Fehren 1" /LENGTH=182 /DNA_ID=CAMNT_0010749539 /DNA_START=1354 /DNA_END=1902 /DNA_ORIENTATION=-